jgi:putative aminopeptidase FrvX
MAEPVTFLKQLISVAGLSGHEAPVRELVEAAWQPLADTVQISRLGSLHALRSGNAPEPPPALLYAAHMDAIGMMVAGLLDGFLRISEVGGLDPRILPGQLVTVHARQDLPGVIVALPSHLLPAEAGERLGKLGGLLVDVGLTASAVQKFVRVGDLVSFAQPPVELSEQYLAGHSLDNRASVAALTQCLQALQGRQTAWDVWFVATTQEEETLGGGQTSAFQLRPSLAVAVDVTFGSAPGSPAHLTSPLGKGPTLGWGANIHPGLYQAFKELAERLEIPYKTEPMPTYSGTDAQIMQIVAEGIPTMVLSIPLRYMHSPVEMVSLKDIARAGRLLAEFAVQLDAGFMDRLTWGEGE